MNDKAYDTAGNLIGPSIGVMFVADHKSQKSQPLFTAAELADFAVKDEARRLRDANAPYLGYPVAPPLDARQRLVREVAHTLVRYATNVPIQGL